MSEMRIRIINKNVEKFIGFMKGIQLIRKSITYMEIRNMGNTFKEFLIFDRNYSFLEKIKNYFEENEKEFDVFYYLLKKY